MPESPTTSPLAVEHPERGTLAVVALWDIDGTVNDETKPESERLGTIAPAKKALDVLQSHNIPSGPITSRSSGEGAIYASAMETTGPNICEDGAVIIPSNKPEESIILSKTDREALAAFITFVQDKFPGEEIISTIFSTREELMQACGHSTVEEAEKSAERHASAYVVPASDEQRAFILDTSDEWNIRAFGEVINLIGKDANKGKALERLDEYAATFWGEKFTGILPIIFGNNTNDVPSLKKAIELGGIGILVSEPEGGYKVKPEDIPASTTLTNAPHGYGILESVKTIQDQLEKRFGLILS